MINSPGGPLHVSAPKNKVSFGMISPYEPNTCINHVIIKDNMSAVYYKYVFQVVVHESFGSTYISWGLTSGSLIWYSVGCSAFWLGGQPFQKCPKTQIVVSQQWILLCIRVSQMHDLQKTDRSLKKDSGGRNVLFLGVFVLWLIVAI